MEERRKKESQDFQMRLLVLLQTPNIQPPSPEHTQICKPKAFHVICTDYIQTPLMMITYTVFPRLERARSDWLQEVLYSRAHCDRGRVVLNSNPPLSVNSVVVFPSNLTPRAPQHNIQFTSPQTLLHFTSFFAALAARVHKSTNS